MKVRMSVLVLSLVLVAVSLLPTQAQEKKGTGMTPTPPPASAVFRVTLNGFTVVHETADDPLERDGRRDEVYVVAEVWGMNRQGNFTYRRSLRSRVMGDPTGRPERIAAGSTPPGMWGGQAGGLRSGDSVPVREPWRRVSQLSTDRIPMLLWEGELQQGRDVIVIMPTLWEWDREDPNEIERNWDDLLGRWISSGFKPTLMRAITNWQRGQSVVQPIEISIPSSEGNRPIGILPDNNSGGRRVWLRQPVLLLTYNSAQEAIASSTSDKGTGIFEIRVRETVPTALVGWNLDSPPEYVSYLQVERIR